MRSIAVTVLLALALALGLGIFCSLYTRNLNVHYHQQIEGVILSIREKDWEAALEKNRALEADWKTQARVLSLLSDHALIDSVSLGLTQLRVSLEEREGYHALLYAAELQEALELIDSRDTFVLKNIL